MFPHVCVPDRAQMDGPQERGKGKRLRRNKVKLRILNLTAVHLTVFMVSNVFKDGRLKTERKVCNSCREMWNFSDVLRRKVRRHAATGFLCPQQAD